MNRATAASLAALALLGLASMATPAAEAPRARIPWETDYERALARAQESGKPVLIDFVASWCGPCKRMDIDTWSDAKVVAEAGRYVPLRIDIDMSPRLASQHRASVIPNIVLTDPWANELQRHVGYLDANPMTTLMRLVPSDFSSVRDAQARLARDKGAGDALVAVGDAYLRIGLLTSSTGYFERALKTEAGRSGTSVTEGALIGLGVAALNGKDPKRARKCFQDCLDRVPEGSQRATALYGLMAAQLRLEQRDEARQTLEALRSQFPGSPETAEAERLLASRQPG